MSQILKRCHNASEPIPPVTKKRKIVPSVLDESSYSPQKPSQLPEPPGEETQLVTQTCSTISAAITLKKTNKPVCVIAPSIANRAEVLENANYNNIANRDSFNLDGLISNNPMQKPFPTQSTYGHSESYFSQPHYPMTYENIYGGGQQNISPPNMWTETYSGNFYNRSHECGLSSYPVFPAQQKNLYETQNIYTQSNFEAQSLLPPIPSTPDPVPFPQFNVPPPNISLCMVSTMNTTSQGRVTYPINVASHIPSSTDSICNTFPQFSVPPPNISQHVVSTMNTTSQDQATYPINLASQIPSSTDSISKIFPQFSMPPPNISQCMMSTMNTTSQSGDLSINNSDQVTNPVNIASQISSSGMMSSLSVTPPPVQLISSISLTDSNSKEDSKSTAPVLDTVNFQNILAHAVNFQNIFPHITEEEFMLIVSECGSVKGYQFHQPGRDLPGELQECLTVY